VSIRRAREAEREHLSGLAFRSKAYWGYSPEFMDACRAELAVSETLIASGRVFVVEDERGSVGFYGLQALSLREAELSHCFVEPTAIGKGVGRALVTHAMAEARRLGHSVLAIQSDPYAAPFYRSLGAREVGALESESVPGRMLPLLKLDL
jgi:GNAT superfamily N-acetyltransferase